jgi:integrase
LNPSIRLRRPSFLEETENNINEGDLEIYMKYREIEDITDEWRKSCELWLRQYLIFVGWKVDESKTLEYLKKIKHQSSITYYRKKVLQIRRFLQYKKVPWANTIRIPSEPEHIPPRIAPGVIQEVLRRYENHPYYTQIKALVLLGKTSGMRAEEMYQLNQEDIDLENRIVRINHNPGNGQTTKTGKSRVSFFTEETKQALTEYLAFFNNGSGLLRLFGQNHMVDLFRQSIVKPKDFRKLFSQEWDRRGGPTGVKKLLMGHSCRNDVDLMHYNAQSPEDLKAIYDKVMNNTSSLFT